MRYWGLQETLPLGRRRDNHLCVPTVRQALVVLSRPELLKDGGLPSLLMGRVGSRKVRSLLVNGRGGLLALRPTLQTGNYMGASGGELAQVALSSESVNGSQRPLHWGTC